MTRAEIHKQALTLSEDERLELAEVMLASVPAPKLTAEQEVELDRRVEEYRKNPASALTQEKFDARVNAHLAR